MSKHDYSAKKTEDRSEELLSSEAFEPEKSGMGKEIKISLTAITILLGVLGYVLYGHFFGADAANGDLSTAAPPDNETPATDSVDVLPVSGASATAGGLSSVETAATTTNRWGGTAEKDQTSTGKSATPEPPSRFNYMPPPAPVAEPAADPYARNVGGSTETPTNTWSLNAGADTSSDSGQANDPFHARTAKSAANGHVSQRQIEGYSTQPQTDSRTQSDWQSGLQSGSQSSAPGAAVASPDTDPTALTGAGQSAALQGQSFGQGSSSGYAAGGSSLRVQPTSQYSTDKHGYVSSDTHGHTGGSSSVEVKSSPSSQDYSASSQDYKTRSQSSYDASSQDYNTPSQNSYSASSQDHKTPSQNSYSASSQDYKTPSQSSYKTPSQPSVPPVSASISMNSSSADSSQYSFSSDKPTAGKYRIEPNDSYSIISEKLYGTASYFKALEQHNLAIFPDPLRLGVGKEIQTPDESELFRLYPELCPTPQHREASKHRSSVADTAGPAAGATVYVVQEGDTLFDIARYELGKASRWAEIYKLNRDRLGKDFDYLTPGLKLAMPSDVTRAEPPVGVMTRRSRDRR